MSMFKLKILILPFVLITGIFVSCIKEDIVDDIIPARIRVLHEIETLTLGEDHQFEFDYFDIAGRRDSTVQVVWTSSNSEVVSISTCLLYTSPSPRDQRGSRMPSSA